MFLIVFQRLFLEIILDFFYFPLWWYTKGTLHAAKWCLNLFRSGNQNLAPGLWLANIFVPMFGQYDIQGRIISFIMRFFQIIIRTIGLMFWLAVCLLLFLVWLALPLAVVYGFLHPFSIKLPFGA
ncbi:MAG: hypothetical protein WC526_03020 [Patescibacteria group bacterium]